MCSWICGDVFSVFCSLFFLFFLMLWEAGWDYSIVTTLADTIVIFTQCIVPYEDIPFPPLLGLLDGPKKCNSMVFTMVGDFWSLVFSRCLSRWATLHVAADTPSMLS